MSSSTSESPPPVISADDTMAQKPKILEAFGDRLTALTRTILKKAREVPIVGSSIGCVEDTFNPWLEPVIAHVEEDGLYLLSIVDDKIHKVSDVAVAHVPFAANFIPQLHAILSGQPIDAALMVLDRVRKRGVVGFTADVWVDYEPIVRSESEKICNLVTKVPGGCLVVSIVSDISGPLVSLASQWLVMQSEVKDKHEIFLQRGVSPSSLDSPEARCKVAEADDTTVADFNALEDKSGSNLEQSNDPSYAETVDSPQISKGEIGTAPLNEWESASTDNKGKLPELTVVHEDEEEQDELSDLFDTWGMGVQAINPRALSNLRSQSVDEGAGSTKSPSKPFSSVSKSSRF